MRERVVEFAPEALEDLRRLYDRIADAAGAKTASDYTTRLEAFCRNMAVAAERGRPRTDIRRGLRIIGFERRITIAFTVSATHVSILRLFYAGQNWEGVLAQEPSPDDSV